MFENCLPLCSTIGGYVLGYLNDKDSIHIKTKDSKELELKIGIKIEEDFLFFNDYDDAIAYKASSFSDAYNVYFLSYVKDNSTNSISNLIFQYCIEVNIDDDNYYLLLQNDAVIDVVDKKTYDEIYSRTYGVKIDTSNFDGDFTNMLRYMAKYTFNKLYNQQKEEKINNPLIYSGSSIISPCSYSNTLIDSMMYIIKSEVNYDY